MRFLALAAAATVGFAALGGVTGASAATFLYSYTSNDGTQAATGTLTAYLVSPGEYEATSGSISAFGPIETGAGSLIANTNPPSTSTSPSGYFYYDDLALPGQNPLITNPGLLFSVGGDEVNIFSNGPGPGTYQFYVNNGANDFGNFALSQISVPEPATWAMTMLGLFGIGAVLRNRRKLAGATSIA